MIWMVFFKRVMDEFVQSCPWEADHPAAGLVQLDAGGSVVLSEKWLRPDFVPLVLTQFAKPVTLPVTLGFLFTLHSLMLTF